MDKLRSYAPLGWMVIDFLVAILLAYLAGVSLHLLSGRLAIALSLKSSALPFLILMALVAIGLVLLALLAAAALEAGWLAHPGWVRLAPATAVFGCVLAVSSIFARHAGDFLFELFTPERWIEYLALLLVVIAGAVGADLIQRTAARLEAELRGVVDDLVAANYRVDEAMIREAYLRLSPAKRALSQEAIRAEMSAYAGQARWRLALEPGLLAALDTLSDPANWELRWQRAATRRSTRTQAHRVSSTHSASEAEQWNWLRQWLEEDNEPSYNLLLGQASKPAGLFPSAWERAKVELGMLRLGLVERKAATPEEHRRLNELEALLALQSAPAAAGKALPPAAIPAAPTTRPAAGSPADTEQQMLLQRWLGAGVDSAYYRLLGLARHNKLLPDSWASISARLAELRHWALDPAGLEEEENELLLRLEQMMYYKDHPEYL